MKAEDQVCTLDQAVELKNLGVKQESLLYYVYGSEEGATIVFRSQLMGEPGPAAFTGAELGAALCSWQTTSVITAYHFPANTHEPWHIEFSVKKEDGEYQMLDSSFAHRTEAEAKADTLIRLLRSEYISLEQVNAVL